jgi:hypothetical protein
MDNRFTTDFTPEVNMINSFLNNALKTLKEMNETNLIPHYEVFEKYVGRDLEQRINFNNKGEITSTRIESSETNEVILSSGLENINEKILYSLKPRLIKDIKNNSISLYLGDTFICKCNA